MFVALREIRATAGRFGLMAGVVALVTVLLVVLTALTNGLGRQSTSAVEGLDADAVVLAPVAGKATFADSRLTDPQVAAWRAGGVTVRGLGIGHTRMEAGSRVSTSAVFTGDVPDGSVVLAQDAADDLGVQAGGSVDVGGTSLTVSRVEPTRWYSHSPVVTVSSSTFEKVTHTPPTTALLVDGPSATIEALAASTGTVAQSPAASVTSLPGYSSEHGSLLLVQAFLYGIGALVVVAFVSVWTLQRTRDLAVLRALGASRRYLLRDALGQAGLLLLAGAGAGALVAGAALLGIGSAAPLLIDVATFAVPLGGVLALGLVGSFLATRRVTRVDPLLALGGN